MSEATRILSEYSKEDPRAPEELLPLVYEELRRLAAAKLSNEKPGQTLQATALVHEAWLKMAGEQNQRYENRHHFYSAAAELMRRILVDRARRRKAVRHGGNLQRMELDAIALSFPQNDDLVASVHEALDELAKTDPEKAEVVKLRFFVGLSEAETAGILNTSERTVRRHWRFAKAWLSKSFIEDS